MNNYLLGKHGLVLQQSALRDILELLLHHVRPFLGWPFRVQEAAIRPGRERQSVHPL